MACGWAGISRCEDVAGAPGGTTHHQIIWAAIALATMLVTSTANYRLAARWAYLAPTAAVILLVAVFLFPTVNGAHRWIRAIGVGFQPSEFAKLAVTLALARYLAHRNVRERFADLLPPLAIALVPVWLILKEPDLGTSLVFLPMLFAMLYVAGSAAASLGAGARRTFRRAGAVESDEPRSEVARDCALATR